MIRLLMSKSYTETIDKGVELGMNAEQLGIVADAYYDGLIRGVNWGAIGIGAAAAAGILYEFVVPGVKKLFSKKDK